MRTLPSLLLLALAASASADFSETFSYPDGPLNAVSGGLWSRADPSTYADIDVTGGRARYGAVSEALTSFAGVLATDGTQARISFDVLMNVGIQNVGYSVYLYPLTAPDWFGANGAQALGLSMTRSSNPLVAGINTYAGTAQPLVAGYFSTDQWHTISWDLTRAAGLATYDLKVDGVSIRTSQWTLNDNRGLNSIELWGGNSSDTNRPLIDNIQISTVPEPLSVVVIAIGFAAAAARRRAAR